MPTDAPDIASSMDAEELVDRYGKRVYHLALDLTGDPHDAEDLSQEVLAKACQSLNTFRGASKPFTWLYRIAVNTYLNGQRGAATEAEMLQPDVDTTPGDARSHPSPSQQAERRQIQADIEEALDVLSPRERTAFVLKHEHDLLIREVAEAMEVAPGTVKSMLYRATRKLRDALSDYRDER
ncbi:MAG: RNA polymerase sigma factor [Salinibacter sp.]|uniref:RNA polymerase sigma factor n=1 Tax=Salinibacter sp. TaxID=2065818 RepID=UPI0035D46AF5